jgi:hypothetical protein
MLVQLMTVKLQPYSKYVTVRWQYGLDDLELDFRQGQENLSSLQCADWLSGPHSPPFNKYSSFSSPRYSNCSVQLTAHLHPMPRLRTSSAVPVPLYMPCAMHSTTAPLHSAYRAVNWQQQTVTAAYCRHTIWCYMYSDCQNCNWYYIQ